MAYRLPRLPRDKAIVEQGKRGELVPTTSFQSWWQSVVESIEGSDATNVAPVSQPVADSAGDIGAQGQSEYMATLAALDELAIEPLPAEYIPPVLEIRTVTTDDLRANDGTLCVDASGGAVTITLPAANVSTRRVINIKAIDVSGGNVTIDGSGSETIDGATTQVISVQYDAITVQCDGTEWWAI